LKAALNELEGYLNKQKDEYPALIRLATCHYQFEAIHSFIDGNGRIGRLLITMLTVHWKLLPQPMLYLSAYFERHQQDYYDYLLKVSTASDWRGWVMFFLRGVREQAYDVIERAKRLQDLQGRWRAELMSKRATAHTLRVVDLLFSRPVVTITGIQAELGVTFNTAKAIVAKLTVEEFSFGAIAQVTLKHIRRKMLRRSLEANNRLHFIT